MIETIEKGDHLIRIHHEHIARILARKRQIERHVPRPTCSEEPA